MIATAAEETSAALQSQAKKTVCAMIEARARAYIRTPRQLDALEPGLSELAPKQLRFRIAALLGEEISTPRRFVGFGGETIRLNLLAAAVYAERLIAKAEEAAE